MKHSRLPNPMTSTSTDRRKDQRYETSFNVNVRFLPDGTPIKGTASEMGPNGMRLTTIIPLVEASYIQIGFETASNNTFCEGRVVWTRRAEGSNAFESGIDIQRWGGGTPGNDIIHEIPDIKPKKDRRKKPR